MRAIAGMARSYKGVAVPVVVGASRARDPYAALTVPTHDGARGLQPRFPGMARSYKGVAVPVVVGASRARDP